MEYLPHKGMSAAMMRLYLKVRDLPGYHAEYQYGFNKFGYIKISLPEPVYEGYTIRTFLYKVDKEETSSEVWWTGYYYYYARAQVNKDTSCSIVYSGEGDERNDRAIDFGVNVNPGDVYSLAISNRGLGTKVYFSAWVNEKESKHVYMKDKKGDDWQWRFKPGNDVVLSIHISPEGANKFPSTGLGTNVQVKIISQPPGSTVFIIFTVTNPKQSIAIGFKSGDKEVEYLPTYGIKTDTEYTAFIRNGPDHWTVSTSFDTTPRQKPHGNIDSSHTHVYLSDNCSIKYINHSIASIA